jgi:hypothetical protein
VKDPPRYSKNVKYKFSIETFQSLRPSNSDPDSNSHCTPRSPSTSETWLETRTQSVPLSNQSLSLFFAMAVEQAVNAADIPLRFLYFKFRQLIKPINFMTLDFICFLSRDLVLVLATSARSSRP